MDIQEHLKQFLPGELRVLRNFGYYMLDLYARAGDTTGVDSAIEREMITLSTRFGLCSLFTTHIRAIARLNSSSLVETDLRLLGRLFDSMHPDQEFMCPFNKFEPNRYLLERDLRVAHLNPKRIAFLEQLRDISV